MLVINNLEKIEGIKYNEFYTISNGIEERLYYTFWLEYKMDNGIKEIHQFPIILHRTPNGEGKYRISYQNRGIWLEKESIQSINTLIEQFRKL